MEPSDDEKHALIAAAAEFEEWTEIDMPWEGNFGEIERERYEAFVRACRAYHDRMTHADRT